MIVFNTIFRSYFFVVEMCKNIKYLFWYQFLKFVEKLQLEKDRHRRNNLDNGKVEKLINFEELS